MNKEWPRAFPILVTKDSGGINSRGRDGKALRRAGGDGRISRFLSYRPYSSFHLCPTHKGLAERNWDFNQRLLASSSFRVSFQSCALSAIHPHPLKPLSTAPPRGFAEPTFSRARAEAPKLFSACIQEAPPQLRESERAGARQSPKCTNSARQLRESARMRTRRPRWDICTMLYDLSRDPL